MARGSSLDSVGRLAASRERDAAKLLGDSHRAVAEQEKQLQDLQAYRDEYLVKFNDANSRGVGVSVLQEYRAFMAKLDQAIIQVQENVIHLQRESDNRRQSWLEKRGKTKAIDKVVERKNVQVRKQEQRREQSQMDECGQRRNK